ncbi:MAG: beta-galactosidase [Candidatus Diapherotrites archaeon]
MAEGTGGLFRNEMEDAGVEIVREWINWAIIEPENNNYDWEEMDAMVEDTTERGIEILGIFLMMPSWAKTNEECSKSDFCEPKDITDFKEFAKKVAERYDGKHSHGEIKYFEIMNEIPVPLSFEFDESDSKGYSKWLINGYEGVKEGNPYAKVMMGSFINPVTAEEKYVKTFIDEMLENHNRYYDIIGAHVFESESDVTMTTQYIKGRMEFYGVNKSLWITETATTFISGEEPDALNKIAKDVVKRFARAFGEGVEKMSWYRFRGDPRPEDGVTNAERDKIFGLGYGKKGSTDFTSRQAYYAYKTITSKLDDFSSVKKFSDTQYKFEVNERSVYVLWCDFGSCPLPSEITGIVTITDYLGNEEKINANQITLNDSPVFVEATSGTLPTEESHFGAVGPVELLRNDFENTRLGFWNPQGYKLNKGKNWGDYCKEYCNTDCGNPGDEIYCTFSGKEALRDYLEKNRPEGHDYFENPLGTIEVGDFDPDPKTFSTYPEGHESEYLDYLEELVLMYPNIKYWEIQNEVNAPEFWQGSMEDYTRLVTLSSGKIREICPDCKVGISLGWLYNPDDSEGTFIHKLLPSLSNMCDDFDFIDAHLYPAEWRLVYQYKDNIDSWKTWLNEQGCSEKEFITTETGLLGHNPGGKVPQIGGSEIEQAKDAVKVSVVTLYAGYSKVMWYACDAGDNPFGELWKYVGMLDIGCSNKKEEYFSLKNLIGKIDSFTSVAKITDTQYKFLVNGKNIYVLWCDSGSCPLPPEITGKVKVTDYLGNEEMKNAEDVGLSESPVFVESGDK